MRFGRCVITIAISALFLLGFSGDRSLEERQLEAQEYMASITKNQQAYYIESGSFADRIDELGLGIPTETENYSYRIQRNEKERVVIIAIPKRRDLKSYTGVVFLTFFQGNFITNSIVCESDRPSSIPPLIEWVEEGVKCAFGSSQL